MSVDGCQLFALVVGCKCSWYCFVVVGACRCRGFSCCFPTHQPANLPTTQPTKQRPNQPTNQLTQPTNQPTNQPVLLLLLRLVWPGRLVVGLLFSSSFASMNYFMKLQEQPTTTTTTTVATWLKNNPLPIRVPFHVLVACTEGYPSMFLSHV